MWRVYYIALFLIISIVAFVWVGVSMISDDDGTPAKQTQSVEPTATQDSRPERVFIRYGTQVAQKTIGAGFNLDESDDGYTFAIVSYDITNNGSHDFHVEPWDFCFIADEFEYGMALIYDLEGELQECNISPGQRVTGKLAYEISEDFDSCSVECNSGFEEDDSFHVQWYRDLDRICGN